MKFYLWIAKRITAFFAQTDRVSVQQIDTESNERNDSTLTSHAQTSFTAVLARPGIRCRVARNVVEGNLTT